MPMKLVRETEWIKEWDTPWGRIIDSKLRWLGPPQESPSAAAFLAAWDAAVDDPQTRADLEAAFEFFPHEFADDVTQILAHIARGDAPRAARMKARHFGPDAALSVDQERFLSALTEHLLAAAAPQVLIADNRYFTAWANDGGFHLDTKVTTPLEMPTRDQLEALQQAAESILYRRILRIVAEAPWLIEPQPGERPLPGL